MGAQLIRESVSSSPLAQSWEEIHINQAPAWVDNGCERFHFFCLFLLFSFLTSWAIYYLEQSSTVAEFSLWLKKCSYKKQVAVPWWRLLPWWSWVSLIWPSLVDYCTCTVDLLFRILMLSQLLNTHVNMQPLLRCYKLKSGATLISHGHHKTRRRSNYTSVFIHNTS